MIENNNEIKERRRKTDPIIDSLKTNLEDLDSRFIQHAEETKKNFELTNENFLTIQKELKAFSQVVTPIIDIAKALKWFRKAIIWLTPVFVAWQLYLELFK